MQLKYEEITIYTHILSVKSISLLSLESNGVNENNVSTTNPNVLPNVKEVQNLDIFSNNDSLDISKQISLNACQAAWRQIQWSCSLSTCSSTNMGIHFPCKSSSTTLTSQETETKIEPNPICRKYIKFLTRSRMIQEE